MIWPHSRRQRDNTETDKRCSKLCGEIVFIMHSDRQQYKFSLGSISILLPPANEVWGKVMFIHLSFWPHRKGGGLWCHFLSDSLIPCFFQRGICAWSHIPSEGVSVKGGSLWKRGLYEGGVSVAFWYGLLVESGLLVLPSVMVFLCGGLLVWPSGWVGDLCQERPTTPPTPPPSKIDKQAVRILLEFFLVGVCVGLRFRLCVAHYR